MVRLRMNFPRTCYYQRRGPAARGGPAAERFAQREFTRRDRRERIRATRIDLDGSATDRARAKPVVPDVSRETRNCRQRHATYAPRKR